MKSAIFRHYLQLFRRYRVPALVLIATVTIVTAVWSGIRLFSAPTYRAAATVVAVPTEAQLQFAREAASAGRATLAETHIEYLKSRPVMESVYERIRAEKPAEARERTGILSALNSMVQGTKRLIARIYRVLNSGTYVASDRREAELQRLMRGVGVKVVPGSFIFQILVEHRSPEVAAAAANALADSYIDQTTADLESSVGQLEDFFRNELTSRQQELAVLRAQELEVRADLGLRAAEGERSYLEDAKELDRRKLVDAQISLQSLESSLESLHIELAGATRSEVVARVEQQIALNTARLEALKREVRLRETTLSSTSGKLDTLQEREFPLLDLQQEQQRIERELSELRNRILDVTLTRTSALTQLRIINPAVVPVYPSSPRVLDDTIAAAAASCLALLLIIVGVDAFSGTIKTEIDLERLTKSAALGVVARDQLAGNGTDDSAFARDLQQRLALAGAFDGERIQVTGFLDADEIRHAASALAEAVTSPGSRVLVDGRELTSRVVGEGNPVGTEIRSLPPLGTSEFRWKDAAGSFVVCLVPAGEVHDEALSEFHARAESSGVPLACMLVLS